jgi:DNA gyrase/topoisomerase IV subunit B
LLIEHGLNNCSDNAKAEFQRLVDTQATLLSVVLAVGNNRKSAKAYRTLSAMWRSVKGSEELYGNAITSSEAGTHIVVFGSYLIQHLTETKRADLINKYKVCLKF